MVKLVPVAWVGSELRYVGQEKIVQKLSDICFRSKLDHE